MKLVPEPPDNHGPMRHLRQDDAQPTANKIGYGPDAYKLINFQGTPITWIDHTSPKIPAHVKCEFDLLEIGKILSNSNEIRRYTYKYQPAESTAALKSHCGQMVTINLYQDICIPVTHFVKVQSLVNIIKHMYTIYVLRIFQLHIVHVLLEMRILIIWVAGVAACWYKPCVFNTGFKDPTYTSTCTTNVCPLVAPGIDIFLKMVQKKPESVL